MMRVRFASGLVVQYNDAHLVTTDSANRYHILYTDKTKKVFIARVPFDAIVEGVDPCAVYNEGRAR